MNGIWMDPVTILYIIAAIASIIGATMGIWQRFKSRKSEVIKSDKGQELGRSIEKASIESRKEHTKLCKDYIEKLYDPEISTQLLESINTGLITDPSVPLPSDNFIDGLCSVMTKEGKAFAMLPSQESVVDIEGVGRTSIILQLLGINIPLGRMHLLDKSAIESLTNGIPIYRKFDTGYRVLTSDMAYIGNSRGRLSIIPTIGEMCSFVWDIARHIFRLIEINYKTGDHRKSPGREKLFEIFKKISLSDIKNVFGQINKTYCIDEVIILNRQLEGPLEPRFRELEGDELEHKLHGAFLASLLHGSDFWRQDQKNKESKVDTIMKNLDKNKLPTVYELTISHPEPVIPNYVFEEVTEIVKNKKEIGQPDLSPNISKGSGIRFHNDKLFRCLREVNQIDLLVTSGEKLFSDIAFWKSLMELKNKFTLNILMLDPDSHAAEEREKTSYNGLTKVNLRQEINENIETMKRWAGHFKKIRNQVNISCKLFSEMPSFRMSFFGDDTLLVTSYIKGKRTGLDTGFYEISKIREEGLYKGFKKEYERIAQSAKLIDLS